MKAVTSLQLTWRKPAHLLFLSLLSVVFGMMEETERPKVFSLVCKNVWLLAALRLLVAMRTGNQRGLSINPAGAEALAKITGHQKLFIF